MASRLQRAEDVRNFQSRDRLARKLHALSESHRIYTAVGKDRGGRSIEPADPVVFSHGAHRAKPLIVADCDLTYLHARCLMIVVSRLGLEPGPSP